MRVGLVFDKLLMALRRGVQRQLLVSSSRVLSFSAAWRLVWRRYRLCTLAGRPNIIVDVFCRIRVTVLHTMIRCHNVWSYPIVLRVRAYRNM